MGVLVNIIASLTFLAFDVARAVLFTASTSLINIDANQPEHFGTDHLMESEASRHVIEIHTLPSQNAAAAFLRAIAENPSDAKSLKFGNAGASDTIVDGEAMPTVACFGSDAVKAAELPFLRPSSPFHVSFEDFPAELINSARAHCLVRSRPNANNNRISVDLSANNQVLVCAQNGSAPAAVPPFRTFNTGKDVLQYILEIPPVCQKGGARSPCPVVTALHGVADLTVFADSVLPNGGCKSKMAVILVIPHIQVSLKGHHSWEDLEFVRPLLVHIYQENAAIIDFERLYLYGQSMGASGAVFGGMGQPDLFTDVFAISPQHMWLDIPGSEALTKAVSSKWDNRGGLGQRRLRRMLITVGGEDAMNGVHVQDAGIIPRSLAKVGIIDAGVNVDIRFFPQLGHVCWFAAFNELYSIVWLGDGHVPTFSPMVSLLVIALVVWASWRLRGHLRLGSSAADSGCVSLPEVLPVETSDKGHTPSFESNLARVSKGKTFLDFLRARSQRMALAAIGKGKSMNHAELYKLAAETDLSRFGIVSQSRIGTLMPAGEQAGALMLAFFHRYAVAPLSAALQPNELLSAIQRLGVKALITTPELARKVGPSLPKTITLLEAKPSETAAGIFELVLLHKSEGEGEFAASPPRCNGPDDIVLLLQTSGTTQAPKVVPVTLQRLMLGGLCWADAMNVGEKDIGLNMMPMYHIGGIITNMLAMILSGGGVVFATSLRDAEFLSWLKEWGVTYYAAVPTMHAQVIGIFEQAGGAPRDLKLRRIATGAAHTPYEVLVRLRNIARVPVVTTYGMTECMPIASAPCDYALLPRETVGKAICGNVGCFFENGKQLPAGEEGELCVKGPLVMKQYLSGGEASHFTGGWFRTGDLCTIDGKGWIYLLGRSKEVINRGGELISPFEIDSAASQYIGVQHCLSFSAPHKELGEAVALAVVPRPGVDLDVSKLRQFMAEKLSAVKVPEAFVLVQFIPKGATGKPERIRLAKILGMEQIQSAGARTKVFRATFDEARQQWTVQQENSEVVPTVTQEDSLGFARNMNSEADKHLHLVQQALYGICVIKLIWQHWLPASMSTVIPVPLWLCAFLEFFIGCRTLLVLIFPLLGYFDGRAALNGESPKKRFLCMLGIYVGMAWAYLPFAWGFATFHRWPIAVWISCAVALRAFNKLNMPTWSQVALPFALAPLFGNTLDALHEFVGLSEHPQGGLFGDPSLLFLEHRFYWSVGSKFYFIGCYMLAYHYLAPRQDLLQKATSMGRNERVAALVAFLVLTFIWQHLTPAKDPSPSAISEISDWPRFFGLAYPLQALTDWATMALFVIAVGSGNTLLRLLGANILGSMICHMYFQLPFADILHHALSAGGPPLVLILFFGIPVVYNLTICNAFQAALMSVAGRVGERLRPLLAEPQSTKA